MKTLNDYMKLPYKLEIVPDTEEGGFIASYPDLPGCISCGDTVESAAANALDAKKAWLEAAIEDGIDIRQPNSSESYSGQFKLRLPKSLHKQLAEDAKRDGISMNQYCIYLLSQNNSLHAHKYSKTQK
ncbi:MAG: toxin-antitoxin system HicB family antitoxin [Oscillospiraceae bacterium]